MDLKLYVDGKILPSDSKAVAIVGTRTPSKFGIETTRKFSSFLAKNKITIVSGLARGIDTVAHKAALEAGGRTIAVLGSGLDVIYPPENIDLAKNITKNGAIVTEFDYGVKPLPKHFLSRNRVIAALSLAVLVVEGRRRSGTISTAHHAADLNREVFVVQGNPNPHLSEAPNYLLENGASAANGPEDILSMFA